MLKAVERTGQPVVGLSTGAAPGEPPEGASGALDEKLKWHMEMFGFQHNHCDNNLIIQKHYLVLF